MDGQPKAGTGKRTLWKVGLGIGIALWIGSFVWLFWLMDKLKLESTWGWAVYGILFFVGSFLSWISWEILYSKYEFLPSLKKIKKNT